MRIFFYFLHVVLFIILSINMPHSVMISPHSVGICQFCIEVHGVPVKARRDHLIHPIGEINQIYIYIIHQDLFVSTS